jgi:hypothetical protein
MAEIFRPVPGEDKVLVKVRAANVDGGTLHLLTGLPRLMRIIGFGCRRPKALNPDFHGIPEPSVPCRMHSEKAREGRLKASGRLPPLGESVMKLPDTERGHQTCKQQTTHGCKKEGDTDRDGAPGGEVRDLHRSRVLKNEDQQQHQHQGRRDNREPCDGDPRPRVSRCH